MFSGLLLQESLIDLSLLENLHITRTETWQVSNAAPEQPGTWTAVSFEVQEDRADRLAEQMSQDLKPSWYINGSTDRMVYVVFPGRIFKVLKGDPRQRAEAQHYGLSIGIPESQLDWEE